MKSTKIIICVVLFIGMNVSFLQAQIAGNPVESRGTGEWTVSAIGTYMDQQVGEEHAISKRLLLKSGWGVTPWLDVYGLVGGVQVDLKPDSPTISEYHDKLRFGYGIGVNMASNSRSSVFFQAGCQAIRFSSQGSFEETLGVGGGTYTRVFEMNYDWREVRANVNIVLPFPSVRFYLGGAGWLVQRLDTKREFLVNSDARSFIGEEEGENRSGLWTGGIIGVEFLLPNRYAITLEGLIFNERNYQVVLGICQTGRSTW